MNLMLIILMMCFDAAVGQDCTDYENWGDKDGYKCDEYGSCTNPGWQIKVQENSNYYKQYANFKGEAATDACCACGGGFKECRDIPHWADKDGYTCSQYGSCKNDGWKIKEAENPNYYTQYANNGVSARDACCECGKGQNTTPTTNPPTSHFNWIHGKPNHNNTATTHEVRQMKGTLAKRNGKGRIISGGKAEPHEYPWQVKIPGCGGSIISDRWILTAAHCGRNGQRTWVDVANRTKRFEGVMVCHPGYDDNSLKNDICLIKLTTRLPKDDPHIRPIGITNLNTNFDVNNCTAWVTGWGSLHPEGGMSPDDMYELSTRVWTYNNHNCKYHLGKTQMCAYSPDLDNEDSCFGDSGGPLFIDVHTSKTTHVYVQTGLVSWGTPICGQHGGVYTNLSEFQQWIRQHVPDVHIVDAKTCDKSYYIEGGEFNEAIAQDMIAELM